MIMISGDTVRTAEVSKGNDQRERVLLQYGLETFELGLDEDGEPITTSLVSDEVFELSAEQAKKQITISATAKAGLRILFDLIADGETTPRPNDLHVPAGVSCVSLDKWKERLIKKAKISKTNNTNRTQFRRIHDTLESAGKIGIWGDVAWPCQAVSF